MKYYLLMILHLLYLSPILCMEMENKRELGHLRSLIRPILDRMKLLVQQYKENSESKPVVVIAGPSGVGKTTFASQLAELLRQDGFAATVFSQDDYFWPAPIENPLVVP